MSHLILILDGPLQSWGGTAPFWSERPTEAMPTLSGITGLIANAFGHRRSDPLIAGLADAELHVRADRPGRRIEDFHTIGGNPDNGKGVPRTNKGRYGEPATAAILTNRYYLSDAAFTVHWTPGTDLDAEQVAAALQHPRRPLYLGRRSCVPALDPLLGITDLDAAEAFSVLPLLADAAPPAPGDYYTEIAQPDGNVTVAHQSPGQISDAGGEARYDVPVTFDPAQRWQRSSHRWIRNYTIEYPPEMHAGRGRRGRAVMLDALNNPTSKDPADE